MLGFFCRSSFSDFAAKYGKEDRFKGMEKMRERENLFNEFILEVRKKEKEEKSLKKEQVCFSECKINAFTFRSIFSLVFDCLATFQMAECY